MTSRTFVVTVFHIKMLTVWTCVQWPAELRRMIFSSMLGAFTLGFICVPVVIKPPYPPVHLASSEQLCWSGGRGILTELSLCYSIVQHFSNVHCTIIMSSSFRLVYWIGPLDRALISFGLALSPPSTSVSSDFMVLCKCFLKIILTSLYLVEGLAWWDWPGGIDQLLSFSAWHYWLG